MENKSAQIELDPLTTRIAETQEDLLAAYRLRYEVYIAEQRKSYAEADAEKRIFTDELDREAAKIVVCRGARIVGTVRTNWFDATEVLSRYRDLLSPTIASQIPLQEISVSSRLAVSSEERSGDVRAELFNASYKTGLARNTKLSFVLCRPSLRRLFRRYGYREYLSPITVPGVGIQHRMLLALNDLSHFAAINSPFLAIAVEHGLADVRREWLSEILEMAL